VQLVVKDGAIIESKIYSDSLYLDSLEALEQALIGVRYKEADIDHVFKNILQKYPDATDSLIELRQWFISAIQ
ncbi:MAG: lipoate protein ligase C-terminal domain-containing protein, partial [Wohlfahrtiimonas sp.]